MNKIKNIYYNWKKNSILFTKYSIFKSNKTIDGQIYMREFKHTYLYNNDGNKIINHEHIIYISPFQIKKILTAPHLYFDCTFIYPKDFIRLLIVLYFDNDIKKRAPGCYILLNNKSEKGYICALQSFKNIITLEGSTELSFISYTTDYEMALYKALENIFPGRRRIGCFFHYSLNKRKNAKDYGLLNEINKKAAENFINDLLLIPFKIQEDEQIIDKIFSNAPSSVEYQNFKKYFIKQWEPLIKTGILNYAFITKEQRSNSFIEKYNRRIKTVLCK